MRILMVGALSWNPERVRSLHERGHELWGTWARSMVWDRVTRARQRRIVQRLRP
jgi:hypothetical protein